MFHNQQQLIDEGVKYLRHVYQIYNEFSQYERNESWKQDKNDQNDTLQNTQQHESSNSQEFNSEKAPNTKLIIKSEETIPTTSDVQKKYQDLSKLTSSSIKDPSTNKPSDYIFDSDKAPPLSPLNSPPQKPVNMKWIRELSRLEPFYKNLGIDSNSWGYPGSVDKLQQRFQLEDLPPPGPMPNFSYQDYEEIRYAQNGAWARDQVTEGTHYARAGNHEEAIKCYNKALFTHPDCHEARIARGASKANMLDLKGAVHDFRRALEICPDDPFALKYLKQTMKKLNETDIELKTKKKENPKVEHEEESRPEDPLVHYHNLELQDPRIAERSKTGKSIAGGRSGLPTHRLRDPLQVPLDLIRRNRRYPESQLPSIPNDSSRFSQLNERSPERLTNRHLVRPNSHRPNIFRPDTRPPGSHQLGARPNPLARPTVDKEPPPFVHPQHRHSFSSRGSYRGRGSYDETGSKFARTERPHDAWNSNRTSFTSEVRPTTHTNTSAEIPIRPPRTSFSTLPTQNKNDPNYDPFWDPEPKPKFTLSGSNQYIPPESKLRTQPQFNKIETKPNPEPQVTNTSNAVSSSISNDPFWGQAPKANLSNEDSTITQLATKPQTEADIKDPALDPFWSKDIAPDNELNAPKNESGEVKPEAFIGGQAIAIDKPGHFDHNSTQSYRGYRGRGNPYYRGTNYRPRAYNPNYRPYRPRGYHYSRGGYNFHYQQPGHQYHNSGYQPSGWDANSNDVQGTEVNPNFSPTAPTAPTTGSNDPQNNVNQANNNQQPENGWDNTHPNLNATGWGSPNFT